MVKAAEGNLKSLLFDYVRESDIQQFAKQAEENWGVIMSENELTRAWVMTKPKENDNEIQNHK